MRIFLYILILLNISVLIVNVLFFQITYNTAEYLKDQKPKEIIITKYKEIEKKCVCPESEKSWIDMPAVAEEEIK